jgi:hypothetical protein
VAIFRCEVKSISRAKGRSVTAAAAYRSAEKLHDDRSDQTHNYSRRSGVASSELILPDGAKSMDRAELWNAAEASEKRKDAKVGREAIIALPHELNDAERKQLAGDFGRWLADRHGVAVDVSVHTPDRKGDWRNDHAHLLMTTRTVGPDGLGEKTRDLDVSKTSGAHVDAWRKEWEHQVNGALERGEQARGLEPGIWGRVDHRSLEAQGIERQPEPKMGPAVTAMERRGEETRVGDQVREVREHNAEIIQLAQERERRAEAERAKTAEEARRQDAQRAADAAEKAERAARYAQEREQYLQALAERCEKERQGLAHIHAQEKERLTRDQWQRAAQEQRQDAVSENAVRAAREPEKGGGVAGWVLDRINPGRAQERLKADLGRKEREAKERQAERDRIQRERDERNRQEQQSLASKQERERANQQRMQDERAKARMAELREAQAVRDRRREQEKSGLSRAPAGPEKDREMERSRPGPGRDFGR